MARELTHTDADALIAQYIGPHPSDRGLANYWLADAGIQVWAIIAFLEANGGDADAVAAMFEIPRTQVEAVQAFYTRHRAVIDDRIAQNRFE